MFAEPLQDELVVQQPMKRTEQEDVEGEVTNLLLLKVSTHGLHLTTGSVVADRRETQLTKCQWCRRSVKPPPDFEAQTTCCGMLRICPGTLVLLKTTG